MAKNKTLKVLASMTALVAIVGGSLTGVNGNAEANSTVELEIQAGVTTMYAPDSTLNSDLCTVADDGNSVNAIQVAGTTTAVSCSATERAANFTSGLSVQSSRQTADTVLNDILFEDLSGNASPTYTVTLTAVSDLIGAGGNTIELGSNPDNITTAETVLGAPTAANAGKLFLYVDPTDAAAEVSALAPQAAKDALTADPNAIVPNATAHTVIADGVQTLNIYSSSAPVTPGRYTMNGLKQYIRVPAFVAADTYTMTQTYDITVS